MNKLESCPFCGGKVRLTYSSNDNMFNFWHSENGPITCFAAEPIQFDGYRVKSLKEAAEAWNRRVGEQSDND